MVANIQHFLDDDGNVADLPDEAIILVSFLSIIIETASSNYDLPVSFADTICRCLINGQPCLGDIEVWVYTEDNQIGWECLECGDDGIVSNWEGTQWDKRNYTCH